jgi:hypothetical protein
VVAGAVALLAAACGSSPAAGVASLGKAPTTTATTLPPAAAGTGPSTDRSVGLAFARCMQSHGVPDFPDPGGHGGFVVQGGPGTGLDPRSPVFRAAQSACQKYLPDGGRPSPAQQAQMMARALQYSHCMRSHGVLDFPDPQALPGGGIAVRISGGAGGGLNPNSAQFQAAQKACRDIMGTGPFKSAP